jgi:acyl carrier protein
MYFNKANIRSMNSYLAANGSLDNNETSDILPVNDNFERVQKIIAEKLDIDPEKIKRDSNFTEDLGADSLDVVELVIAIEYDFNMDIDDDAASQMTTVQDILDYIEGRWYI